MHASRVVARTGSGYRRTVGDEFFTGSGSAHVALDATARVCSGQTHVVKLADDALYERDTGEVGSAQSRHAQDTEHTGYRTLILRNANESHFFAEVERRL